MRQAEYQVYVLRPNNTSLWLPASMIAEMGLKQGERLTEAQFNDERIQSLIFERANKKVVSR